mgnify:CR=1 FL=1
MSQEELYKYSDWIVNNQDKLNTPEGKTVVEAFKYLDAQKQKHPSVSTDYNFALESGKRVVGGLITPLLSTQAGVATSGLGEVIRKDLNVGGVLTSPGMGPASFGYVPQAEPKAIQEFISKEDFAKTAESMREEVRNVGETLGFDKRYDYDNPNISLALNAISQAPYQMLSAGFTMPFQLYSEYVMTAEDKMKTSWNDMTDDQKSNVNLSALPYITLGTALEYIGFKGVVSPIIKRFQQGETVSKNALISALKRGGEVVGAGVKEGGTEYLQGVLQDVTQSLSGIDENDINIDMFWSSEAGTNFKAGLFGGGGVSTIGQLAEGAVRVVTPKQKPDREFAVSYTDLDGQTRSFSVPGPNKEQVLANAKEALGDTATDVEVFDMTEAVEGLLEEDTIPITEFKPEAEPIIVTENFFDLPPLSNEEKANASVAYINKKYVGPDRKIPKNPGYANFLNRLNVHQYKEGRFIDVKTGEDVTNFVYDGGNISINPETGVPSMVTDPTVLTESDLRNTEGNTIKVNLLAKSGKWEFVENPRKLDVPKIISVHDTTARKHHYTLSYQSNNPIKLEQKSYSQDRRTGALKDAEQPQGRPVTKGKVKLGKRIGTIRTKGAKGKEHPLYETITVGEPIEIEAANAFGGPVSIEQTIKNNELETQFFNSADGFFDFYEQELRRTGNFLVANPKNYKRVAEMLVRDMTSFYAENPQLVGFYEADQELTDFYLKNALGLTDAEVRLAQIVSGINSPATPLKSNAMDDVRVMQSWKKNKNFDDLVLKRKPSTGNLMVDKDKSKFILSSLTNRTKVQSLKALEKFIKLNPNVTLDGIVDMFIQPVTVTELNRLNKQLGYQGNVAKLGEIRSTVMAATGQDTLIPRAFVFGPKVGPFILNGTGNLNYTTIDIWESRLTRSFFKGLLSNYDVISKNQTEKDIFIDFGQAFNTEFRKQVDPNATDATLQALRWYYVLTSFKKLGYARANTDETKSEYTRQAIKRVLGIDLPSGRQSIGESAQAAGDYEGGRSADPVRRSLFQVQRVGNQFSYKGREGFDPRGGLANVAGLDLTEVGFVDIASKNKADHKFGSSVDVFSPEDYKDYILIVNTTPTGENVTAAISPSGELSSVTKSEKATEDDVYDTINAAILTGKVRWAQAFDTILPAKYVPLGFRPVSKVKFDPKFKPDDWNYESYKKYKGGKPDIVFFAFDGELNREYYNFSDVPYQDNYDNALQVVDNTDLSVTTFKTPYEMMQAIDKEFRPIAKSLGISIEENMIGDIAAYIADDKQGGMRIQYNPVLLAKRTKEGVRAAMREELIHAVQHQIAMKMFPNEGRGGAWRKLMTAVGENLTPKQRDVLSSVYTSAKTDKQLGAEYLRAATQYGLFGETSEQFVEGGPAWKTVTKLFLDTQDTVLNKLGENIEHNINIAEVVRETSDILKGIGQDIKAKHMKQVEMANAATEPKYKNKNPNQSGNTFSKSVAEWLVPFHQRLSDIHPAFRQLEFERAFNINQKTQNRLKRVKRFVNVLLKDIPLQDKKRLTHFLSFNPTEENKDDPFSNYYYQERDKLLRKYNIESDFQEVRKVLDEIFSEHFAIEPESSGFRYQYFPRSIKDKVGLINFLVPEARNEYDALILQENNKRETNVDSEGLPAPLPALSEAEEIKILEQYLRRGSTFKVKGNINSPNMKQRSMDVIPMDATEFFYSPEESLLKYIEGMTDTIESKIIYGSSQLQEGQTVETGLMYKTAQQLYSSGQIAPDSLSSLRTLIQSVMATRSDYKREMAVLQGLRSSTYLMTIADFDSAISNFFDLELVLGDTGAVNTVKGAIQQFGLDLTDFGIVTGKDQVEFNMDDRVLANMLTWSLKNSGFYGADALAKGAQVSALLNQARHRANQPMNSKHYQALVKDIQYFFPTYNRAEIDSLIANLKVTHKKTPNNVGMYIFSKISMYQPISEASQTEVQLNSPNARWMFALMGYQLSRINFMRNRAYKDIASGDPKRVAKGVGTLVKFTLSAAIVGVPIDWLRKWINGTNVYLPYMFLENSLRSLAFINQYDLKQLQSAGPLSAVVNYFSPAAAEVLNLAEEVWRLGLDPEFEWTDMKLFKSGGPFNTITRRISGYDKEYNEKLYERMLNPEKMGPAYKLLFKDGLYPTFNDNYLGR